MQVKMCQNNHGFHNMHFQYCALIFYIANRVTGNQYILVWKSRREKKYMCRRNRNCNVAFHSCFENLRCSLLIPKGRFGWKYWNLWQNISSTFTKGLVAHINKNIVCIVFCTDKFYIVLSFVRFALCYACCVMNSKSINLFFFCCSCRFLLYNATRSIIDSMYGEWALRFFLCLVDCASLYNIL